MTMEARDLIMAVSVLVALFSMVTVSRNARKATSVNVQSLDLARIRDLRIELKETKEELDVVKRQATELSQHLTEANDRAITYARLEAEMRRFARMPGVTIDDWLRRFDPEDTHEIARQR